MSLVLKSKLSVHVDLCMEGLN